MNGAAELTCSTCMQAEGCEVWADKLMHGEEELPMGLSDSEHVIEVRRLDISSEDEGDVFNFVSKTFSEHKLSRIYSFALSHPVTLTYMVLLGGAFYEWQASPVFSFLTPPLLAFATVHFRLKMFLRWRCKTERLPESLTDFFSQRQRGMWVARQGSNIVGTVGVQRTSRHHSFHAAELKHLAVEPNCRRQGVGQALLNVALQFCQAERYRQIWLAATSLQDAALKLYKKNGFVTFQEESFFCVLPGVTVRWLTLVLDISNIKL